MNEMILRALEATRPYVAIARPDHWFKNVFMVIGIFLAFFLDPRVEWPTIRFALALLATCLVASSNYVINEILDAPSDRAHPTKKNRPAALGQIQLPIAIFEWVFLVSLGLLISASINRAFLLTMVAFIVMGIVYNVPPIRSKDLAFLDVLTESINNPIRLFLGWFVLIPTKVPPLSLIITYWMLGAFFMAIKRLAEFRGFENNQIASDYRKSFQFYTEDKLLGSAIYYATMSSLFFGVFLLRYHLELVLLTPLVTGLFAYYLILGLRENSLTVHPEKLYRDTPFVIYIAIFVTCFLLLLYVRIPFLYELFRVESTMVDPLWVF
jgi:decaprenyl-phosphate phosphoribosyltransferase